MKWKVTLSTADIGSREIAAAVRVLRSRWLSTGDVTARFEAAFAAYTGARHAVALTNATAALHLACVAAGIGPGDEVVLPSLTFVATANAVLYAGARPVFAEVRSAADPTLDPADVARRLTRRTKAILPVHYAGAPCDMDALGKLARTRGLVILEDCAHSVGTRLHRRHTGRFGAAGCFSFFANKNMTTGEGGMIVSDDDAVAARARLLRSHGMTSVTLDRHRGHASGYDVTAMGFNYRIDEVRSAIGLVQLARLDAMNARRAAVARVYEELLRGAAGVVVPFLGRRGAFARHIFPVVVEPALRNAVRQRLAAARIQTSVHYDPIHLFTYYQKTFGHRPGDLPRTERIAAGIVTLPLHQDMRPADAELVCRELLRALRNA